MKTMMLYPIPVMPNKASRLCSFFSSLDDMFNSSCLRPVNLFGLSGRIVENPQVPQVPQVDGEDGGSINVSFLKS